MTHQTGIKASTDLKTFFATVRDGSYRLVKVGIENEELVFVDSKDVGGAFEDDYDNFVLAVLEENQPCYLFVRFDTKNNLGFEWLFVAFTPDYAEVRKKMLYAATRSTLKTEFGVGYIREEICGTQVDDVCLAGYHKHLESKAAPAPLTDAEYELKHVERNEHNAAINAKAVTLPGIHFPIDDGAIEKIENLRDKQITYVQLSIDFDKEEIHLADSKEIDIEELPSNVPTDKPRYHFFLFKHTHEGDYMESIVFIYSMPGYSCSVKERMLYSTCKAPLLEACESVLKVEIAKKIEVSDGTELTEEFLQDEVHPKKILHRPKFAKPKGPGGAKRGAKRMIKAPDQGENKEEEET